jgi:NADPH-dependent ferric siderophore reductase
VTLMEVADPSARIEFEAEVDLHIEWRYRDDTGYRGGALLLALREMHLPDGEGYIWAAGEATLMSAVRQLVCVERGIDKRRVRVSAYWKRGAQAVHETLDG